ncbi:unnamed protein product [Caenorhabditis auriculariae]|uniref:CS domain-containing protein n=1 Tax=Caenorhabditis auriculariae TaxID=2777116 RepID=A0A8S1HQ19_9PELO|nr:unnamed protein product [Caenorhabditis auriculariae]
MAKQPSVLWAQRETFLYVTIEVDEAKVDDLKAEPSKLHFAGSSKTDKYETTLEFFEEIDPESVKRIDTNTRVVELTIQKKEPKWWPRLLKEKGKVHWLKVDFSKWKDEDDEEADDFGGMDAGMGGAMGGGGGMGNGFDLSQYMSQLNPGGGGADFDGLDDEDDMPELEDNEEEEEGKVETKA